MTVAIEGLKQNWGNVTGVTEQQHQKVSGYLSEDGISLNGTERHSDERHRISLDKQSALRLARLIITYYESENLI